ncbi:hypothetical protein [Methanolobus profundi]|uniref:hypothetical protein n=1 Tax=Methanolobus profundi TaxID=487685 RepID=UPI001FE0A79D|nr:hypothetical protein [Methanolobus profundi]
MIKDKISLEKLLQRMYWIEAEMEQLGTWEARIEMMEDNVAALETLSHDSDQHGEIIKKWLIKGNINIPTEAPPGLPKHIFDFDGLASPEMFRIIMKYEILAMNVYKDMSNTDPEIIKELLPEENDASDFLSDMEQLIKDESMHAGICKKQIGGFTKVMY